MAPQTSHLKRGRPPIKRPRTGRVAGALCGWLVWFSTASVCPAEDRPAGEPGPDLTQPGASPLAGSTACRECHAPSYASWAASFHGRSLRPYPADPGRKNVTPQAGDIRTGGTAFHVDLAEGAATVSEHGPLGERLHRVDQVLGGRQVLYLLTSLDAARLQVLPVAYDVRRTEWFNPAASAVRPGTDTVSEPLDWKDPGYTFNVSCYGCHVSQPTSVSSQGVPSVAWAEPGINCEACHGPASGHVRVCQEAPPGTKPKDLHLVSPRRFTNEQLNSMCAPCHAKRVALTSGLPPGGRFFDHYDLGAFEDPDFYPDGRDLGENYTYTLWRTSPCVKAGRLNCLHCHTTGGAYRFPAGQANQACLPCHAERVQNVGDHSHHAPGSPGRECVGCHMPDTEFARMRRHDHSMRPPTPATTIAWASPNACNLCHTNQTAAWADRYVRQWYARDYQAPALERAGLVAEARRADWRRLPEVLAYVAKPDHDDVFAASLIRLLGRCDDERKWPVLCRALQDSSPLVRGSAAQALAGHLTGEALVPLLTTMRDDYRLVRVRSAPALATLPHGLLNAATQPEFERAVAEYEAAQRLQSDDPAVQHELGLFHLARGEPEKASQDFEVSLKLRPGSVATLISAATAAHRGGYDRRAEEYLRQAMRLEPTNAAPSVNLGALLEAQGRGAEARAVYRAALPLLPEAERAKLAARIEVPGRP